MYQDREITDGKTRICRHCKKRTEQVREEVLLMDFNGEFIETIDVSWICQECGHEENVTYHE